MRKVDFYLLIAITLLSLVLRFHDLESTPRWFNDEGENLNIAYNLSHGRLQWFSMKYAFVGRPPLFFLLGALAIKMLGFNMLSIRVLSATLAVLTTILLYFLGKTFYNRRVGLLSAFFFAVLPASVVVNRMGFIVSLSQLLITASVLFFIKYYGEKSSRDLWFALSCTAVTLGLITEYLLITLFFSLVCVTWIYDRKKVVLTFTSLSLLTLFGFLMLILEPYNFLRDFYYAFVQNLGWVIIYTPIWVTIMVVLYARGLKALKIFGRIKQIITKHGVFVTMFLTGILALTATTVFWTPNNRLFSLVPILVLVLLKGTLKQLKTPHETLLLAAIYLTALILVLASNSFIAWIYFILVIGFLGSAVIKDSRGIIFLIFLLPLAILVGISGNGLHRIAILYPLLSIGVATIMSRVCELPKFWIKSRSNPVKVISLLLVIIPIIACLRVDHYMIDQGGLAKENLHVVELITELVGEHAGGGGLVIAPAELASVSGENKIAYLPQVLAYQKQSGGCVLDYIITEPATIPSDRFVYKPVISESSIVILDDESYVKLRELMKREAEEIESWQKMKVGEYRVYIKPT